MSIHLLIVEDDPVDRTYLKELLSDAHFTFDIAEGANQAIELLKLNRYHVMLTDLGLPDGNGEQLIEYIERERLPTISVIISGHLDIDRVISLLRFNRASDYLVKPIGKERLTEVLEKAYETHQKRLKVVEFSKDEKEMYRQAVEIFDWRKEIKGRMLEFVASNMIHQMNLGLFQGQGLGGLLSSLSIFFHEKKEVDGGVLVPAYLVELLQDGFKSMQSMTTSLQEAQTILQTDSVNHTKVSIGEIHKLASNLVAQLKPDLKRKSQRIIVSDLKFDRPVSIEANIKLLEVAMNELIVNAMKYSSEKSEIYVLIFVKDNYLELKILNPEPTSVSDKQRIAGNSEYLIFEPFYRLHTTVDESYSTEKFPLGMGLTVVKKIIELCNGSISVSRIDNHAANTKLPEVCFTTRFPLID
ncbi:MAG: response regulator [Leptonema sp. (in: Bacteria)]|nr:response regulator [Leptonema sp. (in: bacteria)]